MDGLDQRELLAVVDRAQEGRLLRPPARRPGPASPGKIADTFNDVVEHEPAPHLELERLSRSVGKEGKITQRMSLAGAQRRPGPARVE